MNSDLILKKIGTRIREIRENKGISQQDLASTCNFEKANMSRIEAGRTNFTISTLYKISQALEITIAELVNVENQTK
jgi:transcriptional regulator with XRE-family HTH domain